jgi:hypothetical protein
MFTTQGKKKLINLWISDGTRVFEYWDKEIYEVIVEPWTDGVEASKIAKSLNERFSDSPNIKVTYDKDPVFQWQ